MITPADPNPSASPDPMDALAHYVCRIAAGDREALNAGFAMVRAAIDKYETVPKVERDKVFGRFVGGVALRLAAPAGEGVRV